MHVAVNPAHGRRVVAAAFAVLGLTAGLAALRPQPYSISDLIVLSSSASRFHRSEPVLIPNAPVLAVAIRHLGAHEGVAALRPRIRAAVLTPNIIAITAIGESAAGAIRTDNAVTTAVDRYIAKDPAIGPGQVAVLPAAKVRHRSALAAAATTVIIGLTAGLVVGAVVILIFGAGPKPRQAI